MLISAERANRPNEFATAAVRRSASSDCPFCPGNEHLTPLEVLSYREPGSECWSLRVVPNKYPAVAAHEVIIESPEHTAALGEQLFQAVRDRILHWRQKEGIRYLQFFKNAGAASGASVEHPHSQLIGLPMAPKRVQEELDGASQYWNHHQRCFFCDLLDQERRDGARLILETGQIQVIAPWAPRFVFETWILPKAHLSHFENTDTDVLDALVPALRILLRKLDEAAGHPAYNLLLHTAPVQEGELAHFHWHLELLPRIAGVAGFEWATGYFINTMEPEEYAGVLRDAQG